MRPFSGLRLDGLLRGFSDDNSDAEPRTALESRHAAAMSDFAGLLFIAELPLRFDAVERIFSRDTVVARLFFGFSSDEGAAANERRSRKVGILPGPRPAFVLVCRPLSPVGHLR